MKERLEAQMADLQQEAKYELEVTVDNYEYQLAAEREKVGQLRTSLDNRFNDMQRQLRQEINDLEYRLKLQGEDQQEQVKALALKQAAIARLE